MSNNHYSYGTYNSCVCCALRDMGYTGDRCCNRQISRQNDLSSGRPIGICCEYRTCDWCLCATRRSSDNGLNSRLYNLCSDFGRSFCKNKPEKLKSPLVLLELALIKCQFRNEGYFFKTRIKCYNHRLCKNLKVSFLNSYTRKRSIKERQ